MISLRPCTIEDLRIIKANPVDEAVSKYPDFAPDDNSFTAVWESKIIGCGGIKVLWTGVGELWIMLAKEIENNGMLVRIKTIDIIKDKINDYINKYDLWRVQAVVRSDFPQAIKLIEFLGLEKEGHLKMYAPDKKDMLIYGKIL
jgi:RimJ/RimL family protein N-acetyltransferase